MKDCYNGLDEDSFKNKFEYWDEWTSSRYERQLNPNPQNKNVVRSGICRSNPVTGIWFELKEEY